jgi:hypothetical protein
MEEYIVMLRMYWRTYGNMLDVLRKNKELIALPNAEG